MHADPMSLMVICAVGLGRMGSEMAYNLFASVHAENPEADFVVCDAFPEAAGRFCQNLIHNFPAAKLAVATTPQEQVYTSSIHTVAMSSQEHVG